MPMRRQFRKVEDDVVIPIKEYIYDGDTIEDATEKEEQKVVNVTINITDSNITNSTINGVVEQVKEKLEEQDISITVPVASDNVEWYKRKIMEDSK